MPITRKQFELGIDEKTEEMMKKIHDFISEHKDEAFTATELYQIFEQPRIVSTVVPPYATFDDALQKLVDVGAVEKRFIRDVAYYSLGSIPLTI